MSNIDVLHIENSEHVNDDRSANNHLLPRRLRCTLVCTRYNKSKLRASGRLGDM
jgi:hypothetical protein